MKYKINKQRLFIIVSLMILEIISVSLAIRSYGNKNDIDTVSVINESGEYLQIISKDGWPKENYELSSESSCIENSGKLYQVKPEYSSVNNTIVMEFDRSIDCYLYFNNNK